MSSEFVTTKQAAKSLGVHPSTIARFVKSGKLTPHKDGRRVYFARTDINKIRLHRIDELLTKSEQAPAEYANALPIDALLRLPAHLREEYYAPNVKRARYGR